MAPLEGEYRIFDPRKVKIISGHVISTGEDKGTFVIKGRHEHIILQNADEVVHIGYAAHPDTGYISISKEGPLIIRGTFRYKPTMDREEAVEKGEKDVTIERDGRYRLTVRNT